MSLTLYFHPLSSFCQKVLVALYENETPFEPRIVNLLDEAERADFRKLWPIGKFPVLRDEAHGAVIPESTIIIEHLARRYPDRTALLPADPELAQEVRLRDRLFDLYLNVPMQKIVTDRLRPAGRNDPHGVEEARTLLGTALDVVDREMAAKTWAAGDVFTMADCAAAPALFYADKVAPLADRWPRAAAYLGRLKARPSYARALKEAEPYFANFPQ